VLNELTHPRQWQTVAEDNYSTLANSRSTVVRLVTHDCTYGYQWHGRHRQCECRRGI